MALVVGTNSWVSVAEADTYFTNRVGASDWFDLDEPPATPGADSKDTFLISAFYWLFDDQGFNLPQVSDDPIIKRAQEEAALFLMKYSLDYENRQAQSASGIARFKNSKWEEDLSEIKKPQVIFNILGGGGYSVQNGVVNLLPDDYE